MSPRGAALAVVAVGLAVALAAGLASRGGSGSSTEPRGAPSEGAPAEVRGVAEDARSGARADVGEVAPAPRGARAGSGARATSPQAPAVGGGGTASAAVEGRLTVPPSLAGRESDLAWSVTRGLDDAEGTSWESSTSPLAPQGDGTYSLGGLAPGSYALALCLDGRVVSEVRRVFLGPGERCRGVDFDFVRRACVRGVVLSETTGRAVEGAEVRVGGQPTETTDAEGRFVLYDLDAREAQAIVTHPAHAPARLWVQGGRESSASVLLRPGAQARIVAADPDGTPRPGVRVLLFGRGHLASGVTDEDGIALVGGLEPGGRYVVDVPGPEATALLAPADPPERSEVRLVFRR